MVDTLSFLEMTKIAILPCMPDHRTLQLDFSPADCCLHRNRSNAAVHERRLSAKKRPVIKAPEMSRGEYLVTPIGPVIVSKARGFNHLLAGGNRKEIFAQIGILSWDEIFGAFIARISFENVIDNLLRLVRSKDTNVYQVKKSIGYLV